MRRHFLLAAAFVLTLPSLLTAGTKPNVIIFLADDTGYVDIGVQGGPPEGGTLTAAV